ncbi:MAG: OadG family protein [Desulfobacterales bacterium]|nr:OadG family protein [Desulfobacterales bacterium]
MERIIVGLQVTVIGMSVVFLILILINLALNLMRVFFSQAEPPKKAPAKRAETAGALDPGSNQDEGRLIAVLTAAILADGETKAPFRTLSIRALDGKRSAWKENARRAHLRGKTLVRSRPKTALR